MSLSIGDQILSGQLATGTHQLQQQLAAIGDPEVQQAPGSQGGRRTGHRLQEVDLLGSAPLDSHLADKVEEVDLTVEGAFGIRGQGVQFLQNGQLLGLQSVAASAEQIQSLTVLEEDGLLGFMNDKLRAQIKVFNGVLPDQSIRITLVLDDGCQPVLLDFLGL